MSALAVLSLCAAVAAVLAIAIFATRWSRGKQDEYRLVVAASDAALAQAARSLGLEFVTGPVYDHPMVGRIPAFGLVRGVLCGVSVSIQVVNEDPAGDTPSFRTELCAELGPKAPTPNHPPGDRFRLERSGAKLVMLPKVAKTGSVQAYVYRVVTDAARLVDLLNELTTLVG
jgi:hypothetical protein